MYIQPKQIREDAPPNTTGKIAGYCKGCGLMRLSNEITDCPKCGAFGLTPEPPPKVEPWQRLIKHRI